MDSIRLIAALGNPGPEYRDTRHNLGFMLADLLVDRSEKRTSAALTRLSGSNDCQAWRLRLGGAPRLLVKPLTYMNRSGDVVARLAGRESIRPEEILVVHDDMDLDLGRIKLKQGGGSGGHKGVDSVAGRLGSPAFWRLRLGIGRPPRFTPAERYVLQPLEPEEADQLPAVLEKALRGLEILFRRGSQAAVQALHTRPEPDADEPAPDRPAQGGGEQGNTPDSSETASSE